MTELFLAHAAMVSDVLQLIQRGRIVWETFNKSTGYH